MKKIQLYDEEVFANVSDDVTLPLTWSAESTLMVLRYKLTTAIGNKQDWSIL